MKNIYSWIRFGLYIVLGIFLSEFGLSEIQLLIIFLNTLAIDIVSTLEE